MPTRNSLLQRRKNRDMNPEESSIKELLDLCDEMIKCYDTGLIVPSSSFIAMKIFTERVKSQLEIE